MFDDPVRFRRGDLRPVSDRRWRAQVEDVAERFRAAFPEIVFDVAWRVRTPNGVAWREIDQRHARLYGGLVRHRLIGIEAVALLFAHEAGHHCGGEPRDAIYAWMTCERQADRWAAQDGVARAWCGDRSEARRIVRAGARQLLAFERNVLDNAGNRTDHYSGGAPYASPDARCRFLLSASRSLAAT